MAHNAGPTAASAAGDQPTEPARAGASPLLGLDDPAGADAGLTGGKAAALARARGAGLPTPDGFVLTTDFTEARDRGAPADAAASSLRDAWSTLTSGGEVPLVVRSSSTIEDQSRSSMAGRFETVVDVRGWPDFLDAVERVLASRATAVGGTDLEPAPLAVLVQPLVEPTAAGVRFGVDPVTGRADRRVVEVVEGRPDRLVGGRAGPTSYVTDATGTVVTHRSGPDGATLSTRQLRELADLGQRADELFGGPQDVEWAVVGDGAPILLQSRPVTTEVRGVPHGPVLGAGPVAETFPDPLRQLERELWVSPLREAVGITLLLTGAASPREVDASPLVTHVDGVVVVDLEAFGVVPTRRTPFRRFEAWVRRIRASWRVGRLRHVLPTLDLHLLRRVDSLLGAVPALDELTDRQLLALIDRGRDALRSLHGHEILTGLLVDPDAPRLTAATVALRTLSTAREGGADDETIVTRHPVLLALAPPAIGRHPRLPRHATPPVLVDRTESTAGVGDADRGAVLREALRLRVRWVQELTGRAAWELAHRLTDADRLRRPDDMLELAFDQLHRIAVGREPAPASTPARPLTSTTTGSRPSRESLPSRFRLSDLGRPIPETDGSTSGLGAGGGTGEGPVSHRAEDPPPGAVLVVRTLDPALGGVLHLLGGLVSESGSPLSHAAILAREAGVATVVGRPGAVDELPEGALVRVDGTSGRVELLEPDDPTGDAEPERGRAGAGEAGA